MKTDVGIGAGAVLAVVLLGVVLALTGCGDSTSRAVSAVAEGASGARPVVRAADGATAAISIIACPPNDARAAGVSDIVRDLLQQDELVVARSGGSARLTINTCPGGNVPSAPAAARAR